jgi:hypothetical protein
MRKEIKSMAALGIQRTGNNSSAKKKRSGEYMYGADKTQMKKKERKPSEARIGERSLAKRVEI